MKIKVLFAFLLIISFSSCTDKLEPLQSENGKIELQSLDPDDDGTIQKDDEEIGHEMGTV